MSKELIERLRGFKDTPRTADNLCYEAADRIEELERANQHLIMALADAEALEIGTAERCDVLQADNARLREVMQIFADLYFKEAINALAATPEQSLARIRNQVREECAVICMEQCSVIEEPHEFERCRDAIRATKGQE